MLPFQFFEEGLAVEEYIPSGNLLSCESKERSCNYDSAVESTELSVDLGSECMEDTSIADDEISQCTIQEEGWSYSSGDDDDMDTPFPQQSSEGVFIVDSLEGLEVDPSMIDFGDENEPTFCTKCRFIGSDLYKCVYCDAHFCEGCYNRCVDTRCIYCTRNPEERDITDDEFLKILVEATGRDGDDLRQEIVRSFFDVRLYAELRCGKRLAEVLEGVLVGERQVDMDVI
jgi:hypothetical protein